MNTYNTPLQDEGSEQKILRTFMLGSKRRKVVRLRALVNMSARLI
jgi:hypothetical protein